MMTELIVDFFKSIQIGEHQCERTPFLNQAFNLLLKRVTVMKTGQTIEFSLIQNLFLLLDHLGDVFGDGVDALDFSIDNHRHVDQLPDASLPFVGHDTHIDCSGTTVRQLLKNDGIRCTVFRFNDV